MDEELEVPKPEPKISEVEIILVGLFYVGLDLIDLIPIAGDITDVVAAPMGFYYWAKGISATTFVVAEVLDLIPGIQEIPSRTIGWGIAVWLDRHPKALGKLETAIEIAGVLEGNVEGVEGEQAATAHTKDGVTYHGEDELAATAENGRLDNTGLSEDRERASGRQETGTNAKPSEQTTESDAETARRNQQPTTSPNETETGTEEDEQKKADDERYRQLTEPEGAKDPIEEAKNKYFSEPEPEQSQPNDQEEDQEESPGQTSPLLREAEERNRERLANQQQRDQQTENVRESKVSETGGANQDTSRKAA